MAKLDWTRTNSRRQLIREAAGDQPATLTARYGSLCTRCHTRIQPGSRIQRSPQGGVHHATCLPDQRTIRQRRADNTQGQNSTT